MNSMKSWLMAVFMAIALAGSGAALAGAEGGEDAGGDKKACHGEHHKGYHGKDWAARMDKMLDLSDHQQEQVEAIMAEAREAGARSAYRDARKAVKEAMREEADEATLRERARAAADAKVDMILHHRTVQKRIHEVLTDDQRRQLAEHKEAMHEKMKDHKKKRYHQHNKKTDPDS